MPVIPTTSPPAAALRRDSARVENRGPWITTIVPPSTTGIAGPEADDRRAALRAVRVGEADVHDGAGLVVERRVPAPGRVDDLVGDDEACPARGRGAARPPR